MHKVVDNTLSQFDLQLEREIERELDEGPVPAVTTKHEGCTALCSALASNGSSASHSACPIFAAAVIFFLVFLFFLLDMDCDNKAAIKIAQRGGIRVLYVVALATFDLATARAGASRGVGKRRR
jgi:hypothetical protein